MKKRLRKKLHKGEFQELGFEVKFDYTGNDENQFFDAFIGAVEGLGLYIGGGFVYAWRKSVTPDQRQTLIDWLNNRPDVSNVVAGPLRDAWYGWDKE